MGGGAAVILIAGWFFLQWQLWGIQVTVTQVSVHGLPEGFEGLRIVQLSDLHGHEYGQDSGELLALVAEQEPDLIAITGDLVDQESQLDRVPALAPGLAHMAANLLSVLLTWAGTVDILAAGVARRAAAAALAGAVLLFSLRQAANDGKRIRS